MKFAAVILAALLALANAGRAAAITAEISRAEAAELFVALSSLDAGLAPANAVAAADNLNAIRPGVEALDKGKLAYQRALRALARLSPADAEAQAEKLTAELEAKASEVLQIGLQSVALTDEEITATKIKPATLAVLRRWLAPPK